jgi:hypothetical protein
VTLTMAADLTFQLDRPGRDPVHGRLRGADNRLVLEVDQPGVFAGAGDAASVRGLADLLGAQGVLVRVVHRGEHLVSLGAVSTSWWQRRLTGSRRIRLGSLRGVWTSVRSRARATPAVLPDSGLAPPTTLLPLVPTLRRRPRRPVTTTHDPARGGGARLVLIKQSVWPGERLPVYWLDDEMTIGSDPSCGLVLAGLESIHARIRHDQADEWVVDAVAGVTKVHGAPVISQLLRTGARVELGGHQLAFYREEYADHGRPHGGRIGGELGHQVPQAPRSVGPLDF